MRSWLIGSCFLTLVFSAACGPQDENAGSGVKAPPTRPLLAASALDRAPAAHPKERTAAAMFFSRPVRERAVAAEEAATLAQAGLDDPAVADGVEKMFRMVTVEMPGLDPEFVASGVSVQRVPLGDCSRHAARLVRCEPTVGARNLRNFVVHPASPTRSVSGAFLVMAARIGRDSGRPEGAYVTTPPTFEAVAAAAAAGAEFLLVGDERKNVYEKQVPYARDLAGRNGRPLPIPVVFTPGANRRHIEETLNNPETTWRLETLAAADRPAVKGEVVTVTFPGRDTGRKIVVTSARRPETLVRGAGSAALSLALVAEVARSLAIILGSPPAASLGATVELVHVMDGGEGWEFLSHLRRKSEVILGVVELRSLAPERLDSDSVFAALDGTTGTSAVEAAVAGTVNDLLGVEGFWRTGGVLEIGDPIPAAVAEACGQERVPVVRLALAGRGDPPRSTRYPAPNATAAYAAPHPLAGTPGDALRTTTDRAMTPWILVGRAAAVGVLRASQAFAP